MSPEEFLQIQQLRGAEPGALPDTGEVERAGPAGFNRLLAQGAKLRTQPPAPSALYGGARGALSGMQDFLPASEGRRREAAQTGRPVPPTLGEWYREGRERKGTLTAPDIFAGLVGETPGEMALNLGLGLPGKALKLGSLGLGALSYSPDSESMVPGARRAMLTARQQVLKKLRGAEPPGGPQGMPSALDPQVAQATAKQAQKDIDLGAQLKEPLAPPDTSGYTLFDYSKLGPADDVLQSSRLRPQPRGAKFENLPDWMQSVVSDPYVYRNMERAMQRGAPFENWYDVRQFTDALRHAGLSADEAAKYMQFQQAAAQNLGPAMQSRVANYLWHLHRTGQLQPGAAMNFPKGYGSKTQKGIWSNAIDISNDIPIDSEKLFSYGENYRGNWAQPTVDTHAMRLPAMLSHDPRLLEQNLRMNRNPTLEGFLNERGIPFKRSADETQITWSPREAHTSGRVPLREATEQPTWWNSDPSGTKSSYAALEQYLYNPLAEKLGISPAQAQARAWVGGGPVTGLRAEPKFMLQNLEDMVMRLSQSTGMTPGQVIQGIAQGRVY